MNLQLRPYSNSSMVPTRFTRARRFSIRGLGDGTCQVPQPGVAQVYPACPSSAAVASSGGTPYVAPTYTPPPACSSGPFGESTSDACIALLLSTQQKNMQAANTANYTSDVGTCKSNLALNNAQRSQLGLPALQDTCSSNSYGLTPTGGYTSDASVSGPQTIQDAYGNTVGVSAAAQILAAEGGSTSIVPPSATPPATTGSGGSGGSGSGSGSSSTGNGSGGSTGSGGAAVVTSTTSPYLYWAIGGVAVLALIGMMK